MRFCVLVGSDINLIKYNFAVALQIPYGRILKIFVWEIFKIFTKLQIPYGRILKTFVWEIFKIFTKPLNIANADAILPNSVLLYTYLRTSKFKFELYADRSVWID